MLLQPTLSKAHTEHDGVKSNVCQPIPIRLFFFHGERHKEAISELVSKIPEKIPKDLT